MEYTLVVDLNQVLAVERKDKRKLVLQIEHQGREQVLEVAIEGAKVHAWTWGPVLEFHVELVKLLDRRRRQVGKQGIENFADKTNS